MSNIFLNRFVDCQIFHTFILYWHSKLLTKVYHKASSISLAQHLHVHMSNFFLQPGELFLLSFSNDFFLSSLFKNTVFISLLNGILMKFPLDYFCANITVHTSITRLLICCTDLLTFLCYLFQLIRQQLTTNERKIEITRSSLMVYLFWYII